MGNKIGVGKRAMVLSATLGRREWREGGGLMVTRVPLPCTCISINEQGIACLLFETQGGFIHECFKLGDPALNVRWE